MLLDAVAPWIIESWSEILTSLSFELPVLPLDTYQFHVVLTAACLVLLPLGWRMVGPMPGRARFAALSLLTLAMLSPLAILTSHHMETLRRLPEFAGRLRKAVEHAAAPQPRQTPQSDAVAGPTSTPPAPPPAAQSAAPASQPAPDAVPVLPAALAPETASLPPAAITPPPAPPSVTQAESSTARKVVRRLAKLLPSESNASLMPVFYGTDRRAAPATGRPEYTAACADRLEIGHALIQVPRERLVKPAGHPWTAAQAQIDGLGGPGGTPAGSAAQFAIASLKALSRDDFLQQAVMRLAGSHHDKDHALIFVPGYNTSFEASLYRAAQIAYDLHFDGAPFVYSWPSDGASPDYNHDTGSVEKAAAYFAEFIKIVAAQTGAKTVSFVAHGLGARLTLDGLATLKDQLPPGVAIRELILTTPDIDAAAFKARIASLPGIARRTTLYVASTDRALNISRRYTGGIPRAGDLLSGGPLVMPGIETVDISVPGTQVIGLNHAGYVAEAALISDLAARLRDGSLQSAALESVPTPAGPYLRLR